jgi:hypothetical protein
MTMLNSRWSRQPRGPMNHATASIMGALLLALASSACTQAHDESGGTETGNPPVAMPTLKEALVALVITADKVRVTGAPGAASPGGATVEISSALTGAVTRGTVAADGSFDVPVDGSTLDTFEVRVVADGERSPGTVYVAPGAAAVTSGGGAGLSCVQREGLAHQQLEAVAERAIRRCRIDSDCTEVGTGSVCNDSCSRYAVSKIDAMEIDAARAAIEAGLCKTYQEDGCRFIVQPCVPTPGELACLGAVQCAQVQRDGPNCADKSVCVNGVKQVWPKVCEQSLTEIPSASINSVCLVDERGNVGLTFMTGSNAVTNKGWGSSGYGLIADTLGPNAQASCDAQRAALPTPEALSGCLSGP